MTTFYEPLVVAEKPSVARCIGKVLMEKGVNVKVTSVKGHLMNADFPEGYDWGMIDPSKLFTLRRFRQVVQDRSSYRSIMRDMKVCDMLIIATDNDPEGELIGYEVLLVYRSVKGNSAPYKRMRFNSTSPRELWRAWNSMEDSLNWNWVMKAMFRQHFDLVTGAAFTRLLTEATRRFKRVKLISWGSCQSPTLNFIVEREKEIRSFKPRPFWYFWVELRTDRDEVFEALSESVEDERVAKELWLKLKDAKVAYVKGYDEDYKALKRPLPLNTDELLKDLTKITGSSASKILSIAEELYAEGYCSYPRTETNRFGKDFDFYEPILAIKYSDLSDLLKGIDVSMVRPLNGNKDDGAHPPIYPLKPYPNDGSMKWVVWEYIARRFIANSLFDDCVIFTNKALVDVQGVEFKASGSKILREGFLKVFDYFVPEEKYLPRLSVGDKLMIVDIKMKEGKTRPPRRLSESELLSLMEKFGIGTDATRAEYPKLIVERGYAVKKGKVFYPTELGMRLVEVLSSVDRRLTTPETRRMVEEYMSMIGRGLMNYEECLDKALSIYWELYKKCELEIDTISRKLADSIEG